MEEVRVARTFPNLEKARIAREQKRKEREEAKKALELHHVTPIEQPKEKMEEEKMKIDFVSREELKKAQSEIEEKISFIISMMHDENEEISEEAPEPEKKKQKKNENAEAEMVEKSKTEVEHGEKKGWNLYDGIYETGVPIVKTATSILSSIAIPLMLVGLKTYRSTRENAVVSPITHTRESEVSNPSSSDQSNQYTVPTQSFRLPSR